jgi:hypothetical protein
MIDNTLFKKITVPLQKVVKESRSLEKNNILIAFEKTSNYPVDQLLTTKLEKMRGFSEMIIYKIKDMRDWSMFNRGMFNQVRESFDLEKMLDEVKRFTI